MSRERPPPARRARRRPGNFTKAERSGVAEVELARKGKTHSKRVRPVDDHRIVICELPDPLPVTGRELDALEKHLGALIDRLLSG